ncbi:hypothetical protein [Parasitella parasitica]|uniref:Ubiquitin-like domain-containing protein n=1 Tax=Parasitella parasitica TaxID=35722 RepID=A0A0B7N2M1_9FUNG|nr:hypothetical protein [Parasitella parasitica]
MAETHPETPTPGTIDQIALQIKSLEQTTTSVTLPRNASVLDLKQEIQVAFDVDSNRQRLIFQGRVLKDDKNLTDYANLDNGKVVHLVIRPIGAPHNPSNDDPNLGANIRHTSNRAAPNGRSRTFPSLSNRFPMMEGYAFITLDSTMSDVGDSQSLLTSVLNGLSSGRMPTNRTETPSSPHNNTPARGSPGALPRSPFSFSFGGRNSHHADFTSPIGTNPLTDRISSSLPFPGHVFGTQPSVEVRLARTLGSMRNVRNMLEDSNISNEGANARSVPTPNSTPEQLQEIRNRLRNSGNSQSTQISMVLNELADLMTEAVPQMRQVADNLMEENQTPEQERFANRRILNMSRIVQGMSLINHFLGSVLASTDIEASRRSVSTQTNATAAQPRSAQPPASASAASRSSPSLVRLPSYLFPRGMTESIRATAPTAVRTAIPPSTTIPSPHPAHRKKEKSSLSTSCTAGESSEASGSSSNSSNSKKRKIDSEDDQYQDAKKSKSGKGKDKDKKD